MYEFECLTNDEMKFKVNAEECSPLSGACIPDDEGCCGPDCSPN